MTMYRSFLELTLIDEMSKYKIKSLQKLNDNTEMADYSPRKIDIVKVNLQDTKSTL